MKMILLIYTNLLDQDLKRTVGGFDFYVCSVLQTAIYKLQLSVKQFLGIWVWLLLRNCGLIVAVAGLYSKIVFKNGT